MAKGGIITRPGTEFIAFISFHSIKPPYLMDNQPNKPNQDQNTASAAIMHKVAEEGRNANDDFNEGKVDDYGIDESQSNADEKLEERDEIKGGEGSQSGDRNRNDDFAE